jgi:putative endonuclease
MYYTYVLYSKSYDRLYIGQTQNITHRLESHNLGLVKSTKHYIPWKLIYVEKFMTRSEAMKKEKQLKTGSGREFLRNKICSAGRVRRTAD